MQWMGRVYGMAPSGVLLVLSLCVEALATLPGSAKHNTIHWNSSNPIFRIDNTDNVIDVNRNNNKFEYDQVDLICPVYTPGASEEDMEKYIIYNVSKDEFETCRITNANPRIIAVCDKPYKLMYFTITFRPFTPQPGGLEFLPGHDYYFISTSTGDDLHRRIGGRCTTHNMKIVFKVWAPTAEATTSTQRAPTSYARPAWSSAVPPPPHHQRTTTRTPSAAGAPAAVPAAASTPSTTTTRRPAAAAFSTKKAKAYDKHPNEVVKSEELTLAGSSFQLNVVLLIAMVPLLLAVR